MIIHPGLFALGVLLLLFPADRLLSQLVSLRSFDCFLSLNNSPRFRPWWWVPLLWLDPFRGFAGAFALRTAVVPPSYDWATTAKGPYAVVVSLLCLGVVCQMLTRRERDAFLAPIGFVAGIVAALTPWAVAGIGVTMALTGMFAFRQFHAFFGVGLTAVAALGFALNAGPMWLIPSIAVLGLPGLLAGVSGRALEIPTRNDSGPGARRGAM